MSKVEDRWKDHRNKLRRNHHVNRHLQRSYNKYGANAFRYDVVFECDDTTLLLNMETVFIYSFRSKEKTHGYNMTFGGEGGKMTMETRAKMSIIAKARVGELNTFYGKTHSDDTKKQISSHSKKRCTSEHVNKMISARHNGPRSEQHGVNIGKALRGKPKSEEARQNMKLAWQKRKLLMDRTQ